MASARASKMERLAATAGAVADESMGARRGAISLHGATNPAAVDPKWAGVARYAKVAVIPVDAIMPDPDQPRREFDADSIGAKARSLAERGQLQPIRVRWSAGAARWVIIDGERRWRASMAAGLPTLIAEMVDGEPDPAEVFLDQLVANCVREDLRPMEQARGFRRAMQAKGWKAADLARATGISRSNVSRALALLDLSEEVRSAVDSGDLSPATAYEISKLADPEQQHRLCERVLSDGLSRARAAEEVRRIWEAKERAEAPRSCRVCGCTDEDCRKCIERTGEPCHWVEPDLCSACAPAGAPARPAGEGRDVPGSRTRPIPASQPRLAVPTATWGPAVYTEKRERVLSVFSGVEIVARSGAASGTLSILTALRDAVAAIEEELGMPPAPARR